MKTMKRLTSNLVLASCLFLAVSAQAKIITVNTVDNANFGAGITNLVTALNLLTNGDTINFNISGLGAHHIMTPVNGYPLLTGLTNITINGYWV